MDPIDSTIVVTGRVDSVDFPLLTPIQPELGMGVDNTPNGWSPNKNSTDAEFNWETTIGQLDSFSVSITTSMRTVLLANPSWRTDNAIFINKASTYTVEYFAMSPDGGVGHKPAVRFYDNNDMGISTIGAIGPSGFPPQAASSAGTGRQCPEKIHLHRTVRR